MAFEFSQNSSDKRIRIEGQQFPAALRIAIREIGQIDMVVAEFDHSSVIAKVDFNSETDVSQISFFER